MQKAILNCVLNIWSGNEILNNTRGKKLKDLGKFKNGLLAAHHSLMKCVGAKEANFLCIIFDNIILL